MKHIQTLVVLVLSIFCAKLTEAQETKFTLGGYTQVEYGTDNPAINENSLHLGDIQTTIRPILIWEKGDFKFYFESDFSGVAIDNSNWLKEAWVGYKPNDSLSMRAGRIPRTTIILTPPPASLPLVRYPRVPENIYGWGAQITKKWSNFTLMWDVTTDSDVSFQNQGAFDGIESSLRLQYNLTKNWFIAGSVAYDFDNSDTFGAVNLGYTSDKWNLNAVAYAKDNVQGGFVMATYRVCKPFEVHGGIDVQNKNGSNQVLGTRFFFGERSNTDLTVDYIHSDFKEDEHTLAVRLRYRF